MGVSRAGGSVSPDAGAGEWRHEAGASTAPEPPAKCVLYRPSASHLLAVLATAAEALPPGSALLVYLSASGARQLLLVLATLLPKPKVTACCASWRQLSPQR